MAFEDVPDRGRRVPGSRRPVPTWNYVTVQAHGTITTRHEPDWLIPHVGRLVARHEAGRPNPWALTDAPDDYVRTQGRAIVGLELQITRLEAKVKLSQNRSEADIEGTIQGLGGGSRSEREVAGAMRRASRVDQSSMSEQDRKGVL